MGHSLWHLLERGSFCDLVIQCEGGEAHAHRVVVAAGIPFFRALLASKMRDANGQAVRLKGVSIESLREILNFVYTGRLQVNEENIWELAIAADYLLVKPVLEVCQKFLVEHISVENCFATKQLAYILNAADALDSAVDEFVLRNFEHVHSDEQLGVYEFEDFVGLITSERLRVRREFEVFEAIVAWISFDRAERFRFLSKLLRAVRFLFVTPAEVRAAVDFCRESPVASQLLDEIVAFFYRPTSTLDEREADGRTFVQRGVFPSAAFFPTIREQKRAGDHRFLPQNRTASSGLVFCVGGRRNSPAPVDFLEVFDPSTDQWTQKLELPFINRQGVAALGNSIFVVGGFGSDPTESGAPSTSARPLDSCEVYDVERDEWRSIAPLNTSRGGCSVCAIGGGRLLVVGGFNGAYISSCELYDPLEDRWTVCGQPAGGAGGRRRRVRRGDALRGLPTSPRRPPVIPIVSTFLQ
ncbi:Kelch-like protein 18 isoform X3 [Aphelenchoides fujianensis]|nr:Kelch-like protein 18 isoform X3 [Aphelenchoides fujianensis]